VRNALIQKVAVEERSSPGIYISNRKYKDVLTNIPEGEQIVYLREDGQDVRDFDFKDDVTFVLGDDQDLTPEEEEALLAYGPQVISLGPRSYHADHCITIVNNELDRRGPARAKVRAVP
ncbi:MAG TPA: tRNA (pseudouridine(54)-N(1))-methyltransferase TrmY, partial [Methanomassiliicoccales archaeon]|nr:tRNA (pseudouridine(54)-N(1))-methyltransferase TrmY [Methanomassiliicoccales archaeon]